jgi:hypothetical protein
VEVPRIVIGLARPQPAPRVTGLRVLDLDDVGAEPCERFGARRAGLELREVDDPDAGEAVQVLGVVTHRRSPP